MEERAVSKTSEIPLAHRYIKAIEINLDNLDDESRSFVEN